MAITSRSLTEGFTVAGGHQATYQVTTLKIYFLIV